MNSRTRNRQSGSLLIITLWIITILSVLAVAIARHLSIEVRLTKYHLAREQAKVLARSGVYLAMQRLTEDGTAYDWLGDEWALPGEEIGTGDAHVRIVSTTDEERKLNLNAPLSPSFESAVTQLIHEHAIAKEIVDYLDPKKEGEDKPADTPPYFAKNGPVVSVEELRQLPGMESEPYELLRAQASPHLPQGAVVNINTAQREVLLALGLSDSTVGKIEEFRIGPDGPDAHERDGKFTQAGTIVSTLAENGLSIDTGHQQQYLQEQTILNSLGVSSQTFTVTSEGSTERPAVRVLVQAVIQRKDCAESRPSCIVAWREGGF